MRFLCRIGWHDWDKWNKIQYILAYTSWRAQFDGEEKKKVGQLEERRCVMCGKVETRRIIW